MLKVIVEKKTQVEFSLCM